MDVRQARNDILFAILLVWITTNLFNILQTYAVQKDLTNKLEHVTVQHKIELCVQQTNLTARVFVPCKELKDVVPNS